MNARATCLQKAKIKISKIFWDIRKSVLREMKKEDLIFEKSPLNVFFAVSCKSPRDSLKPV